MDIDGVFVDQQKERKCGSGLCDRMHFQIYDGPKSWSTCFTKTAYFRKDHPISDVIIIIIIIINVVIIHVID